MGFASAIPIIMNAYNDSKIDIDENDNNIIWSNRSLRSNNNSRQVAESNQYAFCITIKDEEDNENVYQTVRVNYLTSVAYKFLGTPRGPCNCTNLCQHKPCEIDYISTPKDTQQEMCICINPKNVTNMCGVNTFCDVGVSTKNGSDTTDDVDNEQCMCEDGYEGDPITGCIDIDECALDNPCKSRNFTCNNLIGSYECIEKPPCLKNNTTCIPGKTCDNCCSGGAYLNDGETCGGSCIPEGTECKYGSDCKNCCNDVVNYWFSNNNHTCGIEACYDDNTECTPGLSCEKQCCAKTFFLDDKTGNAYCGNETIYEETSCIKNNKVCNIYSNCSNCCEDNSAHYYNITSEKYICGNEPCWNDNIICTPEKDCYKCCHGAHLFITNTTTTTSKKSSSKNSSSSSSSLPTNEIYQCGGDCSEDGRQCNYNYFLPP